MKIVPIKEKEVSIYGRSECHIITHFIYKDEKGEYINDMSENVIVSMTENVFLKIMNTSKKDQTLSDFIESFSHDGICSISIIACRPEFAFVLKLKKIFPLEI